MKKVNREMPFLIYMARVLIQEARCTRWRNWKFWLLNTAAKKRREYLQELRAKNNPDHLRGVTKMVEKKIDEHGQWSLF